MSKDEAMMLAWKTLEDAKHNHKLMTLVNDVPVEVWDKYQMDLKIFQAQEALRQALAEPDMGIDRGAWSDVPDATKWVDELRGDEPEEWDHPPQRDCDCKHCTDYWSDVYPNKGNLCGND